MKKIFFYILCLSFLSPLSIHAARLYTISPETASRGEEVLVKLNIDTEGSVLNALSGVIKSEGGVSFKQIQDGNSTLLVWVEKPTIENGSLVFSGFTPGGFTGDRTVLSFTIIATTTGSFKFTVSDIVALRNDGSGSTLPIKNTSKIISILNTYSSTTIQFDDRISPEAFRPVLTVSPEDFNGKRFLSFITQDKGSGIENYQYATAFFTPRAIEWEITKSPQEVSFGDLFKKLYVKAVDRSGNERVEMVVGSYYYATLGGWGILIVFIVCVLLYIKRRSR